MAVSIVSTGLLLLLLLLPYLFAVVGVVVVVVVVALLLLLLLRRLLCLLLLLRLHVLSLLLLLLLLLLRRFLSTSLSLFLSLVLLTRSRDGCLPDCPARADSKFSSFVRQLNFYGFRKVKSSNSVDGSDGKWWEFKVRLKSRDSPYVRRPCSGRAGLVAFLCCIISRYLFDRCKCEERTVVRRGGWGSLLWAPGSELRLLLRGTILNRTYGTHQKSIYLAICFQQYLVLFTVVPRNSNRRRQKKDEGSERDEKKERKKGMKRKKEERASMVEVELRRETRRTQRPPGERVGHRLAFSFLRRILVCSAPSGPGGACFGGRRW